MTDIPIIFSAPMIRAFMEDRKIMTRRLAWTVRNPPKKELEAARAEGYAGVLKKTVSSPWQRVKPGDRLWVREAFCWPNGQKKVAWHRTDSPWDGDDSIKWRPSIHMPRRVSRLTLIVEATKIEPLQEITEYDARAEGVEFRDGCFGTWNADGTMRCGGAENAVEAFRCLWINLHGSGSWEANPEVVALTVRIIKANIDEVSPQHKTHLGAMASPA